MATEIKVPTLGESVTEATIGKWFKKPGDAVRADEPLLELETDKVTLEVNAPAAGVLGDILAKAGETVSPGAVLGTIGATPAGATAEAPKPAASPAAPKPATAPAPAAPPPSLMEPRSAPGATVSPSLATMSPRVPAVGAGTSRVTLSVSSSSSGSSAFTASPGFLNHLAIVASETDSPRVGTRISVAICRAVLLVSPSGG